MVGTGCTAKPSPAAGHAADRVKVCPWYQGSLLPCIRPLASEKGMAAFIRPGVAHLTMRIDKRAEATRLSISERHPSSIILPSLLTLRMTGRTAVPSRRTGVSLILIVLSAGIFLAMPPPPRRARRKADFLWPVGPEAAWLTPPRVLTSGLKRPACRYQSYTPIWSASGLLLAGGVHDGATVGCRHLRVAGR